MTNVLETDQHYQYVPLVTVTQGSPDAFATAQIPDEIVQPDISINTKDVGKSTVTTWEVQEFIRSIRNPLGTMDPLDDTDILFEWQIVSDGDREADGPTAIIELDNEDWVAGERLFLALDVVGGTGGGVTQHDWAIRRYEMPKDESDGQSWGFILTQNHYHASIDSANTTATMTVDFGMRARRVEIEMNEILFDQLDVQSLLLSSQIQSILN